MEFIKKYYKLILFSIPIISFALHFHIFKIDLAGYHVWRQAETQTVINNFCTEDLNILHPRINDHADTDRLHRMEFPLMQWIFALFYRTIGPHIVISRILSFIIGLVSVAGMFYLCNNIFKNKPMSAICAWCFNFSPLFYYYTVNPMPDNLALCCGIWSIVFFWRYINNGGIRHIVYSALFLGIATSVKLPFILYGSTIFAFLVLQLKLREFTPKQLLICAIIYTICIIPPAIWYVTVIPGWGNNPIIKGLLSTKLSGSALFEIFTGAVYSLLPELLINYGAVLFFAAGLYLMFQNKLHRHKYFPVFLFWGVGNILYFLFEMNVITLMHDYYYLPFLPQIFLLVTYGAYRLLTVGNPFIKRLSIVCFAILPLTAFLRANDRWDTKNPEFNPVYFEFRDQLRSLTPKNAYCIVGNDESHYILLYYIDRKGWAFDNDKLDDRLLTYYISMGAQYLFLDDHLDDKPEIKAHLAKKIFDRETLRVYKLK